MESLRPNSREDGRIWLLPKMKYDRSEALLVLEMRDSLTIDGNRDNTGIPFLCFAITQNETMLVLYIQHWVLNVDLSEPSIVAAEIEKGTEVSKGDRVCQFKLFYGDDKIRAPKFSHSAIERDIKMQAQRMEMKMQQLRMTIEMQQYTTSRGIERPLGSKHGLMEKEHEPNKDLNLLTAAYLSMKANVSSSNRDFIVPDEAIYEQRTPLGNTILHFAATYGNNAMVQKVTQHAPHLFTVTNNNYDTALHVAARAGHASTIQVLLNAFLPIVRGETNGRDHQSNFEMMLMVGLTLLRNNQGNTFFHEAFMVNSHNGVMIFQAFETPFITSSSKFEAKFKEIVDRLAQFAINKEGKSLLYMAIEVGCNQVVNRLMDIYIQHELKPRGKSPLLPAIINRDIDMLDTIMSKKPNWIHLRNENGRFPLHDAASMGYFEGVSYLIKKCASCTMEMDYHGFFPIHLACSKGHVKVVQELLKCSPDPTEMLDKSGHNLLHIAAGSGEFEVVKYILQHPELENMINQKDNDGYTPLHLATRYWYPNIVHALTWDKRVNLALLNQKNQTALDIANQERGRNPSLAQRLTWNALQSAGIPQSSQSSRSSRRSHITDIKSGVIIEAFNTEQNKDRIETLIVISTLIITASFAAGFAIPGNVDQGAAVMLNHHMFHLFILSLAISVYGAISTTIILIWARVRDPHLILFALKYAMPLLGISLTTLSLAFLAGVYLVVSKLSWLAITFVMMSVVLILMVVFLLILLWLPSSSTFPFIRYISYYPFLFLAKIVEGKTDANREDFIEFYNPEYGEWDWDRDGNSEDGDRDGNSEDGDGDGDEDGDEDE